jgi:hypothetical protein
MVSGGNLTADWFTNVYKCCLEQIWRLMWCLSLNNFNSYSSHTPNIFSLIFAKAFIRHVGMSKVSERKCNPGTGKLVAAQLVTSSSINNIEECMYMGGNREQRAKRN